MLRMTRQAKLLLLLVLCAPASYAEVYQWKDQYGRLQFSDRPPAGTNAQPIPVEEAQGYEQGSHSAKDIERSARQLKKERLSREKHEKAERQRKKQLHAAWQKQRKQKLANKIACDRAQKKADKAFRNRMQRTSLSSAGNAFDQYEKARDKAEAVCN